MTTEKDKAALNLNDLWLPHDGGKIPKVAEGQRIFIRCRDGLESLQIGMDAPGWYHDQGDSRYDITHWKLALDKRLPDPDAANEIYHTSDSLKFAPTRYVRATLAPAVVEPVSGAAPDGCAIVKVVNRWKPKSDTRDWIEGFEVAAAPEPEKAQTLNEYLSEIQAAKNGTLHLKRREPPADLSLDELRHRVSTLLGAHYQERLTYDMAAASLFTLDTLINEGRISGVIKEGEAAPDPLAGTPDGLVG